MNVFVGVGVGVSICVTKYVCERVCVLRERERQRRGDEKKRKNTVDRFEIMKQLLRVQFIPQNCYAILFYGVNG